MVFVLVLLVIQAAQQAPPRDTKTTADAGSAALGGHVVDAETGAPIAGATVHIAARVVIGARPTEGATGPRVSAEDQRSLTLPDDFARLAVVAQRVPVLENERRTAELPLSTISPRKK